MSVASQPAASLKLCMCTANPGGGFAASCSGAAARCDAHPAASLRCRRRKAAAAAGRKDAKLQYVVISEKWDK